MKKLKDSLKTKELVGIKKTSNNSYLAFVKEIYDFGYEKMVKKTFNAKNKEELEMMLNECGIDTNKQIEVKDKDDKKKVKDSQAQEIAQAYRNLSEKYDLDFEDLVYGPEGFMFSCYPEGFPDFRGDVIFSEKYWNEFEQWLKDTKGITLDKNNEYDFFEDSKKSVKDNFIYNDWNYAVDLEGNKYHIQPIFEGEQLVKIVNEDNNKFKKMYISDLAENYSIYNDKDECVSSPEENIIGDSKMKDAEEKLFKVRVKGHPEALKEVREYLLSQGYSIDYDGYIIFVKGVTEEEGHALATDIVKKFDKVVCAVSTFTWDSIEPNANYTHVVYMWPNAGYELVPFYVNSDTEDTATLIAEALAQAIENGQKMFYYTEEDLEDLTEEEKESNYAYFDLSELGLPNVYISEDGMYNIKIYTKEEDPYKKTEEKAETEAPTEDNIEKVSDYKSYRTKLHNAQTKQELNDLKDEIQELYNSEKITENEFKRLMRTFDNMIVTLEDCNTVKDEPAKMTFGEIENIFYKHNQENGIKSQFEDPNPLEAVVVFSSDNWPDKDYSLESRSYKFTSHNKRFLSNMIGNSVFGESLDGTDRIRIDWYLPEWKVDYCYMLSNSDTTETKEENKAPVENTETTDSKCVKCKDSFKIEFFVDGNLLEGQTEEGFDTYEEAEAYAEEQLAVISQNGMEKEIPLEDITYEITYIYDNEEDYE